MNFVNKIDSATPTSGNMSVNATSKYPKLYQIPIAPTENLTSMNEALKDVKNKNLFSTIAENFDFVK